jgi:RNA polymerase sigma-70 factor (ECF subfamily)
MGYGDSGHSLQWHALSALLNARMPRATDFIPASAGRPGAAGAKLARRKPTDGNFWARKSSVVTGQVKGTAMPVGAAAESGGQRHDEFASQVRAIVQGDKDALSELYDSTVSKVHGLVRAMVHNSADAEEVTCDVYTQVWQTAANFEPSRGCVMSWLLSIARSRALDCLRRQRTKVRLFSEPSLDGETLVAEPIEHDSPDKMLNAFQARTLVRSALEQLSPERRRLVCLAFFDDLSHSEIAELTGLPMGTIKSHLRRAMHSLRGLLYASELE